jgi:hypothetical protein
MPDFSFPSPEGKKEFLSLVRSNEDMGNDYISEFTPPTSEEIRNARPLATVLPQDALTPENSQEGVGEEGSSEKGDGENEGPSARRQSA